MPELESKPPEVVAAAPIVEAPVSVEAKPQVPPDAPAKSVEAAPQPDPANVKEEFANLDEYFSGAAPSVKVEVKPKVEVKEGETVDTTKPVTAKPGEVVAPTDATKPKRDYTGFSDEQISVFKEMSHSAFNYVAPRIRELNEAKRTLEEQKTKLASLSTEKRGLPESYYENPNGFLLSPDFTSAANELQVASNVQSHWQKQLSNIRKGLDWQDLDIKDGSPVLGVKYKADADSEAAVATYLQHAVGQVRDVQGKVVNIQQNFKQKHENAAAIVKEANTKWFGKFDEANNPHKAELDNIRNMVPIEFRNHPMTELAVRASLTAALLQRAFNQLNTENATAIAASKKTEENRRAAGPTDSSGANGSAGKVKDAGPTYEDIDRFIKTGDL